MAVFPRHLSPVLLLWPPTTGKQTQQTVQTVFLALIFAYLEREIDFCPKCLKELHLQKSKQKLWFYAIPKHMEHKNTKARDRYYT